MLAFDMWLHGLFGAGRGMYIAITEGNFPDERDFRHTARILCILYGGGGWRKHNRCGRGECIAAGAWLPSLGGVQLLDFNTLLSFCKYFLVEVLKE